MANLILEAAAKKLGVTTRTLRRWEESGKLVPLYDAAERRYYPEEMLEDFVNGVYDVRNIEKYKSLNKEPFIISMKIEEMEEFVTAETSDTVKFYIPNKKGSVHFEPNACVKEEITSFGKQYTIGVFKGDSFIDCVSWKEIKA